jgi:hypothetical protein
MFENVTDFFGVYRSVNNFDETANGRMVFKKDGNGQISKVIRFDIKQQVWIAGNEASGTIPKPFWWSRSDERYGTRCLATVLGTENKQTW